MTKKKYDLIECFQRGLGKRVSSKLFSRYTNREALTENLYPDSYKKQKEKKPNKVYINRHINELCKKWEEQGFIEKLPISKKDKWGRRITINLERLNFEPLYHYFSQRYNIKFTQKEKYFLEKKEAKVYRLQWNRYQILREYPEDNIIDAIIKFYVKHCAIPNIEILDKNKREILNMAEKHIEEELKRGEDLKKGHLKKREKASILGRYLKKLNTLGLSLRERQERCKTFSHLFPYILNFKTDPELVSSINMKFKKALGILPKNLSAKADMTQALSNTRLNGVYPIRIGSN